ncbi:DUF1640-domain-containing protein [Rhizoclosmatium globosum]|uniref:DUF1640-domain-containing protein n=1 Tax=Rhizoclosmatium globosum TaxID=329046 RepID=A0A1Y2BUY3_9FUNG|nr:DUF1640-domain-containing protein [Rhizoclosmatium globosum]|eukprot:ORY38588.1 DUF1640-domain-containing protein [Rhizoclosmatium globosum]
MFIRPLCRHVHPKSRFLSTATSAAPRTPINDLSILTHTPSTPVPEAGPSERQLLHKSLTNEGFTAAQAETLLTLISNAIDESTTLTAEEKVSRSELDKFTNQSQQDMAKLKMDIRNLSVLDYGNLRVELKRIATEVERLRDEINNDITKTHGDIRLDLNLEKKRISMEVDTLEQMVLHSESKIEQQMGHLVDGIEKTRREMKSGFQNFVAVTSVLFSDTIVTSGLIQERILHPKAKRNMADYGMQSPPDSDSESNVKAVAAKSTAPAPLWAADLTAMDPESIAHEVSIAQEMIAAKYGRANASTEVVSSPISVPAPKTSSNKATVPTATPTIDLVQEAEVRAATVAVLYQAACEAETKHHSLQNVVARKEVESVPSTESQSLSVEVASPAVHEQAVIAAELYAGKQSIAAKMGADIEGHWIERNALAASIEVEEVVAPAAEPPKVLKLRTMVIKVAEQPKPAAPIKVVKKLQSIDAMRGANWPVLYEGPWEYPIPGSD